MQSNPSPAGIPPPEGGRRPPGGGYPAFDAALRRPEVGGHLYVASLVCLIVLATFDGCRNKPPAADQVSSYVGQPPHGGTPVTLGDGDYHVELVLDAATGTLSGYVLDDDLEEFIRSSSPSFEIEATVSGTPRTLVLSAVANSATGETVGDSSLFSVQADWLKTEKQFEGVLRGITIRGMTYPAVKFSFPREAGK